MKRFNRSALIRHHRIAGLVIAPLLALICLSGVVLNHRSLLSGIDLPRSIIPPSYRYNNWNQGLLRGTLEVDRGRHIVYGNSGAWLLDSLWRNPVELSCGLPEGVDNRNFRAIIPIHGLGLVGVTTSGLFYRPYGSLSWLPDTALCNVADGEPLSDLYAYGDSLVVVGRSHLFVRDTDGWIKNTLSAPVGESSPRQSLFRLVYRLHSGRIFGLPGRILLDIFAIYILWVTATGVVLFALRRWDHSPDRGMRLRRCLRWHQSVRPWVPLVLIFAVAFTGWLLRPPGLVAISLTEVPMTGENHWQDKLRAIRYDHYDTSWLLSTTDGIYRLDELDSNPQRIVEAPPVSVMGINVWNPGSESGTWVIGSMTGCYLWNRNTGKATDFFTGEPAPDKAGPPFGSHPTIGWIGSAEQGCPVEYYDGTTFAPQPPQLRNHTRISLWNLALEIHVGRIFTFLGALTLIFITILGLLLFWLLFTGWRLRVRMHRQH